MVRPESYFVSMKGSNTEFWVVSSCSSLYNNKLHDIVQAGKLTTAQYITDVGLLQSLSYNLTAVLMSHSKPDTLSQMSLSTHTVVVLAKKPTIKSRIKYLWKIR